MSIWYDKTGIRAVYANAPKAEGLLDDLLELSRDDVQGMFGPDRATASAKLAELHPDGDAAGAPFTFGDPLAVPPVAVSIPASLRMGQLVRVQEVWDGQQINDGGLDPDGTVGIAGFQMQVPSRSTRFKRMVRPDLYDPRVG